MDSQQASQTLHYASRPYKVDDGAEDDAVQPPTPLAKAKDPVTWVTWGVVGVSLVGWAVVGFFLWIPRVLRAVIVFSVALVQSTVTETRAESAARTLRSAADFYKRGFVGAVESVRSAGEDVQKEHAVTSEAEGGRWTFDPGLIVREIGWALLTWYVILWVAGPIRGTSYDLVMLPWTDVWWTFVDAIAAVPQYFGR